MGRHKFGYAQQSRLCRSRTGHDQLTLVLLRLCYDVCLCDVSQSRSFHLGETELNALGTVFLRL